MNATTASLLCAALVLLALPTSAAAAPPECIDQGENYCVFVDDGTVCVRYHDGDLDHSPKTVCESLPAVSVDGALLCPVPGHYCVTVSGSTVCATYDLGDLEGPYTTCIGKGASATSASSVVCIGADGHYACVGDGCATVSTPRVRTESVCPADVVPA